jgi:hypothetical protein
MTAYPVCRCKGEHCESHKAGEQCPNEGVELVYDTVDTATGHPIANRRTGLCAECFEHFSGD